MRCTSYVCGDRHLWPSGSLTVLKAHMAQSIVEARGWWKVRAREQWWLYYRVGRQAAHNQWMEESRNIILNNLIGPQCPPEENICNYFVPNLKLTPDSLLLPSKVKLVLTYAMGGLSVAAGAPAMMYKRRAYLPPWKEFVRIIIYTRKTEKTRGS